MPFVCTALTRDEWKLILYKQVSERRASERKAVEEATKLDNEEFSPAESEAELTDEEPTASDCENKMAEKPVNKEAAKLIKDNEESGYVEERIQSGGQSDFDGFSDNNVDYDDDDDQDDDGDDDDGDDIENSNDDDEIIVKSKRLTKQLESDSDSEMSSQPASLPATPVIRNFPFNEEMNIHTDQTSELSSTSITKEDTPCKDEGNKEIDSGLGTSLFAGVSLDIDNSVVDSNLSKVLNVTTAQVVIPKRPSEDDTNMVGTYYTIIQCYTSNCCQVAYLLLGSIIVLYLNECGLWPAIT